MRRELRSLAGADREAFLSALEIAHRLPLDEGRALYGPKYMDAAGLTRKHLARMTLDRCTPWHNGKVFFTAHAAFSLEMEQSLQAIDRTIALPFWDHTIDALYFGHDWPSSEIWSEEWFGASSPNSSGSHVITTGRWAYTPIRTNKSAAERNSYGRITDHMNADPVQFLTRGARNVPSRACHGATARAGGWRARGARVYLVGGEQERVVARRIRGLVELEDVRVAEEP